MTFVTNFPGHQLSIYQKVIRMYMQIDRSYKAEIRVSAHDVNGRSIDGLLSLWVQAPKMDNDLSEFWRLFEIIRTKHYDIYIGKKLI